MGHCLTFTNVIEAAHAIRVLPLTLAKKDSDTLALPGTGPVDRIRAPLRVLWREKEHNGQRL